MRALAIVVLVLGVIALAIGVTGITQASSAEATIASEISPLKIADVNSKYEAVKASHNQMRAAEEPNIQAGKAAPSDMYNYLSIQRTSLGLTRSNLGFATFIRMNGILNIIIGVGLVLTGYGLFRKGKA
jgi:hypothetical protein